MQDKKQFSVSKYKPIKDLPQYTENPFIETAIEKVEENTVSKKRFLKGSKGIEQTIINSDGEITGSTAFLQMVEVDEDKFAKLYLSQFAAFWDLSKPAIRVFGYIITCCLIPNKDIFYIDKEEALKYTGYSSERYILTGLSVLCEHGIIARSKNSYKYFINPLVVFNGSRITFAKTYVRKKRKKQIDKNQTSINWNDSAKKELPKFHQKTLEEGIKDAEQITGNIGSECCGFIDISTERGKKAYAEWEKNPDNFDIDAYFNK